MTSTVPLEPGIDSGANGPLLSGSRPPGSLRIPDRDGVRLGATGDGVFAGDAMASIWRLTVAALEWLGTLVEFTVKPGRHDPLTLHAFAREPARPPLLVRVLQPRRGSLPTRAIESWWNF